MSHENTNWNYSAAGVCIKDGKVLLARHTYGAGKGLLIIPGGYLENGESGSVARETGIRILRVTEKNDCQGQDVIRIYLWQKESTRRE